MSIRVLSVVLLSSALFACGGGSSSSQQSSAPPPASQQSSGNESAESYSLPDFTVLATREATPQLCDAPGAPLRTCFQVDAAQCGELFGIAMTQCAHELEPQLPSVVDASNSDAVATQIAECAAQAYVMGLSQQGLRLATPECQ